MTVGKRKLEALDLIKVSARKVEMSVYRASMTLPGQRIIDSLYGHSGNRCSR